MTRRTAARPRFAARAATVLPFAALVLAGTALPSTAAPGAPGAPGSPGAPAAAVGSSATTTSSGTLVELVADDFAAGKARTEWALERGKGHYVALAGATSADVRGLVGKRVDVKGKAVGRDRISVADGTIAAATGSGATSTGDTAGATPTVGTTAETTKRVAVVLVTFRDDPQQPVTADQVRTTMFGSDTDVDAHFQDSSDGRLGVSGDVLGWYTVDRATATSCDYSAWGNAANAAATAAGADLAGYDHVMYFWPQQSACSWAGLGQLPGNTTWINGSNTTRVLAHELSHNLGEHHASAAGSCVEGGVSVVIPTSTASCTMSEYGDAFTIMGSSSYYLHTAAARSHYGWLGATTTAAGEAGSWTLAPVDSGSGTRLVRIPRGDGSYLSLEYRQPHGVFDTFGATSPAATGVTLRLDYGVGTRQTVLFDANPATATYGDAPLAAGRAVTDPVSGARVAVTSVSSAGAQVSVSYGGDGGSTTDPTDPGGDPDQGAEPSDTTDPTAVTRLKAGVRKGTVTLTWRAASDDSGTVTYQVSRAGVTADTGATSWSDTPGPGTWTYSVVAVDAAGNTSAAATVTVTIKGSTAADGGSGKGKGSNNGSGKGAKK